jgi:hypothetical protein
MYRDPIQQRQQQALAVMRAEREERERDEAKQLERQSQANAETRKRYLDGLDAKRAEEHTAAEAAVEAEIAPEHARAEREWLANNAGKTERDFLYDAWPLLRLNIIEQRERQAADALKAKLLASGRYSF